MSILRANLRLYYPVKSIYFFLNAVYQFLALLGILVIWWGNKQSAMDNQYSLMYLIPLFISMFMLGAMTTGIQLDVLTKPFSSCLPNHHKIPSRIIFLIGIIANLFYGFIYLLLPHPAGLKGILYFITIFTIGLSIYFFTAFWAFYIQNDRQKGLIFICCMILFFVLVSMLLGLNVLIFSFDYLILYSSIPLVFFLLLLMFALWKMLVHPDLKRIYFSKDYPMINDQDSYTTATLLNEKLLLSRMSEKVEKESLIGRFYLKYIERLPILNIRRSITGRLYCMLERHYAFNERYFRTSLSIKIILTTLLLFFTGYQLTPGNFGGVPASDITHVLILVIPCIAVHSIFTPVSHTQLLPIGRYNQFWSSVIVWLIQPIIAILWVFIIIILSWILENHMPGITLAGFSYFTYHPLALSLILWPLVIIPVLNTFWYYVVNLRSAIVMILLSLILFALSLFSLLTAHIEFRIILIDLSILLANSFFINRLARYWFRKDLVLFI
jgi:hypothetical protein